MSRISCSSTSVRDVRGNREPPPSTSSSWSSRYRMSTDITITGVSACCPALAGPSGVRVVGVERDAGATVAASAGLGQVADLFGRLSGRRLFQDNDAHGLEEAS